ncbi:hypothetical protein M5E06_10510 [Azospirillum sp. A1-3]|uniref:hypothetical protein n=1 Tax=Azospirillum sp. A1-3 TaxID=185874 RepID=UPI002076F5D6|nr:hypothetical protein [Azospirillum sp. A1-3]MCM8734626.1 hypothetical protein [Azospirillum sp. A1-3]
MTHIITSTTETYFGFPVQDDGSVDGALPEVVQDAEHSGHIKQAGYEVKAIRADDLDEDEYRDWWPEAPGEGWTLAWKAQDEDGYNVCFWRAPVTTPAA